MFETAGDEGRDEVSWNVLLLASMGVWVPLYCDLPM